MDEVPKSLFYEIRSQNEALSLNQVFQIIKQPEIMV